MKPILLKRLLTQLILVLVAYSSIAQEHTNERAKWFTDARFGMFIHWGLYSAAEGIWKGEKLRNDNDYAEWILYRNRIDRNEYLSLLDRFDWSEINPEEWVVLAKNSGMKYVTFTAKHHDGFALWDSKVGDYDLGNYLSPSRDIVRELAEACKKHGLKMGLYYSHWVDWEHQYGWDHTREITGIAPEDYDLYWQEKVIPQVRELLTNYGDIGMFWFDMWIHHSKTVVTKEQLLQLKSLIRELQPGCIINSRLGLSIEEDPDIDFKTMGDNQLGSTREDFPWQSPATVAHSWGYHALDTEWKSTTTLLKSLIGNVSLNGNFMLNIGPRANGDVPYEISHRMLEMGRWLSVNGESVYGAGAIELDKDLHDWGKITSKEDHGIYKLYFHIYNWPLNKKLNLTGISSKPEKIYLLADKQKKSLPFRYSEVFTEIDLPVLQPDQYITVVVAEYSTEPEFKPGLAGKTTDGGYSLTPLNLSQSTEQIMILPKSRNGTIPQHAVVTSPLKLEWEIYVDEPGMKKVDISYHFQGKGSKSKTTLTAAGTTLQHQVKLSGKTVGEPNSNWIIDNFSSNTMGKINFPEKGYYQITLEIEPEKRDSIQFQWLWLH